jgi:hypothetical protein
MPIFVAENHPISGKIPGNILLAGYLATTASKARRYSGKTMLDMVCWPLLTWAK